eukprot:TRINITY_DN5788_c0_g1_i1.p1 TRINITY_DN5788_c0_g1~~TRINITY_DN5788_c0_g1_i1.p1  ORF type:complete len:203 (+),score=48.30 TRINITY_DN5788_c0_g1_i1:202-810(+)
MGSASTKLTEEEIAQLADLTKFDRKEIEKMFKAVMKGNETGFINGEQFAQFINQLGVSDDFIAQILFGVFDQDGDGLVDFKELLVTLSVFVLGTGPPANKIKLIFRVYDINEDGYIYKNEMLKIFNAIFRIKGQVKKAKPKDKESILCLDTHGFQSVEDVVDFIFKKTDANRDEKISLEEFSNACLADKSFMDMMNFFKSTS